MKKLNDFIINFLEEIKTTTDKNENIVLLNNKTIKNILKKIKSSVSSTYICEDIQNIIISYTIPILSKFYINDTNDLCRRLNVCDSLEYCEQGCEQHLYTHMLNIKIYCISELIKNIENTDYMIKLALKEIDYVFLHVILYFYLLEHNIVISKNYNSDDIVDYWSFGPTYIYFHCDINKVNPIGYRLFDDYKR